MTEKQETKQKWWADLGDAKWDPRLWLGLAFSVAAALVLLSAPTASEDGSLRGIHLASAVALLGVGVPQAVLALVEARRAEAEQRRAWRAGLDEQRRVCLIALARVDGRADAEVFATAANALAFHSGLMTAEQGGGLVLGGGSKTELQRTINALCRARGDHEMFPPVATSST
jgi:hypothetical protein